jgi:hypothetical protein
MCWCWNSLYFWLTAWERHLGVETGSCFLRLTYDSYLTVCIRWSLSLVIRSMHEMCNITILRRSFAHLLPPLRVNLHGDSHTFTLRSQIKMKHEHSSWICDNKEGTVHHHQEHQGISPSRLVPSSWMLAVHVYLGQSTFLVPVGM